MLKIKRLYRSLIWKLTPRKVRERRIAVDLLTSFFRQKRMEAKTNAELAEIMRQRLLYNLDMSTSLYSLLDVVIDRLDPGWADRLADEMEEGIEEMVSGDTESS